MNCIPKRRKWVRTLLSKHPVYVKYYKTSDLCQYNFVNHFLPSTIFIMRIRGISKIHERYLSNVQYFKLWLNFDYHCNQYFYPNDSLFVSKRIPSIPLYALFLKPLFEYIKVKYLDLRIPLTKILWWDSAKINN